MARLARLEMPHGSGSTASLANGLNQLVSVGGSAVGHDARGSLTGDPTTGKTYGYSSENLLTSSGGGALASLGYDPAMRLYELVSGGSTSRFGYDGLNLVVEADGANAVQRRYVFGPGVDEPLVWYEGGGTTDRRFLGADERGSIVSVTDGAGALLAINSYDEYGIPGPANVGRLQYTGQMWLGELGLQYSKARIYSPTLGRFLQTDPIGVEGGINLYAYVGNDPVNLVDPLGLQCQPDINVDANVCGPGNGFGTAPGGGSHTSGGSFSGNEPVPVSIKLKLDDADATVVGVNCSLHPDDPRCGNPTPVFIPAPFPSTGFASIEPTLIADRPHVDACGSRGTGGVPDSITGTDISGPCAIHDACYASSSSRKDCDYALLRGIIDECKRQDGKAGCFAAAWIYYYALRAAGGPAYKRAQGD